MSLTRDSWEAARVREATRLRQLKNKPDRQSSEQQSAERLKRAVAKSAATHNTGIRGLSPATSDHEYTARELEFIQAMRCYQATTGRKFPAYSEVLAVIDGLGYRKQE